MDYAEKVAVVRAAIKAQHPAHAKIDWMRQQAFLIYRELRLLEPHVQSRYGITAVRNGIPAARMLVRALDILESITKE